MPNSKDLMTLDEVLKTPSSQASYEEQSKTVDDTKNQKLTHGRKIAIVTSVILANCLMLLSFGATMGGGLEIGKSFGIHDPASATWIAASYPLTHGAFVLIGGRIGAVYGHKNILLLGGVWWIIWSMINGFCTGDIVSFSLARACSGIGAAMVMPNAVAVIGITFPPGRMRNMSFGFFGFAAPVAGTIGCVVVGLFIHFAEWKWFFFFAAIVGACHFSVLWIVIPAEDIVDKHGKIDWIGAVLGVSGLVLFNFVWNQAPAEGWFTSYEFILLFVSLGLFVNFILWEYKFASHPIMPLHIWKAPSFSPLVLVVTFSIMSYGTALWYMVAWQQIIRKWTVLEFATGLIPHAIAGSLAAPFAAWLIPRIAAQWIMAFGAIAVLLSAVLLASMPPQQEYWTQVFPATILMSLCPDFIFTAAQIIITNSVRRHEQGIAGSLVSLLQLYGASIGLGFAGTVESNINEGGKNEIQGYRGALYFAIGLGIAALIIDLLYVRVPKDERDGWSNDEDRELS